MLGEHSFIVLEQESEVGGLCRSTEVDGAPLDIGGGHFLEKRPDVLGFLFRFMPASEWDEYARRSTILLHGKEVDYPLEANLWQLPVSDQVGFLESIAEAGSVRGTPMPESFEEWITWKLGSRIAEEYMLPYNSKIWSVPLDELGTYWLHKLPTVSFRDTLQSCLERRPFAKVPAHAAFLYPKHHGCGEVWTRIGRELGDRLVLNTLVTSIDPKRRVVNEAYQGDLIVTTIPWHTWLEGSLVPDPVRAGVRQLRYASIDVDYCPEPCPSTAHWVYEPDPRRAYHRILNRGQFCRGARGYWTETNSARAEAPLGWRHRNEYAYPLNTRTKPQAVESLCAWARTHHMLPLGRWGIWEHMNSDVAILAGIAAAEECVAKEGIHR